MRQAILEIQLQSGEQEFHALGPDAEAEANQWLSNLAANLLTPYSTWVEAHLALATGPVGGRFKVPRDGRLCLRRCLAGQLLASKGLGRLEREQAARDVEDLLGPGVHVVPRRVLRLMRTTSLEACVCARRVTLRRAQLNRHPVLVLAMHADPQQPGKPCEHLVEVYSELDYVLPRVLGATRLAPRPVEARQWMVAVWLDVPRHLGGPTHVRDQAHASFHDGTPAAPVRRRRLAVPEARQRAHRRRVS